MGQRKSCSNVLKPEGLFPTSKGSLIQDRDTKKIREFFQGRDQLEVLKGEAVIQGIIKLGQDTHQLLVPLWSDYAAKRTMPLNEGSGVWNSANQLIKQLRWMNKVEPDSIPSHRHHDVLQNRAKMKPSCLWNGLVLMQDAYNVMMVWCHGKHTTSIHKRQTW